MSTNDRDPSIHLVTEWDTVEGSYLGAVIECTTCGGSADSCAECSGVGTLHRPYRNNAGEFLNADGTPQGPPPAPMEPDDAA